MKGKHLAALAASALLSLGGFNALADSHEGGNIGRVYLVDVKDGHGQQFRDGVKEWMTCYGENDGKMAWNVWAAETGKLGRYAFTTGGHKWAAFGEMEPADEACAEIFYEKFLPHIAKTISEFTEYMPDISRGEDGEFNVVEVVDFEVGDSRKFMGAIAKVNEASDASEWEDPAFWYSVEAGGRHAADFFLVLPEGSFAGFDEDGGFWEMVAEHHGEEGMTQIRNDFRDSIDDAWSNIWRREADLGYSPDAE